MSRRSARRYLAAVTTCWIAASSAAAGAADSAQTYPNRPVRFVVPFTVGGSADNYARVLAQRMATDWNRQVVVDNRAGSNGIIGTDLVAKAPADGYTLLLGTGGNIATNPALYKRLPYRVADFTPVTLVSTSPFVLLTPLSVPATSVSELIALARARPGQLNYVSTGIGSPGHLTGELLAVMTGIRIVHVPYKSHGTMMADMASGQVHIWFNGIAPAQVQLRSGKVRALGVTSRTRAKALPEVPAIAEAGVPGYEVIGWYGVFVPAGTAQPVVEQINAAITNALRQPEVRERFLADGAELVGAGPATFTPFVRTEIDKWARLIKVTGVTAD